MKKRVCTNRKRLYALLEREVAQRNHYEEISRQKPDPLWVASRYQEEFSALICALFSYGNVHAIVGFLESLDFSLLEKDEETIRKTLVSHYYRFQTSQDIQELFITLSRLKKKSSLEAEFMRGYRRQGDVMDGLEALIGCLYDTNAYRSKGYEFLLGKIPQHPYTSPYKRWHMFLRWMVRCDCLDFGLWKGVSSKHLLMPLDVHTFNVGKRLGLIERKTYDFKAVLELTQRLREFDACDPVKYDFALYRIGQEKITIDL